MDPQHRGTGRVDVGTGDLVVQDSGLMQWNLLSYPQTACHIRWKQKQSYKRIKTDLKITDMASQKLREYTVNQPNQLWSYTNIFNPKHSLADTKQAKTMIIFFSGKRFNMKENWKFTFFIHTANPNDNLKGEYDTTQVLFFIKIWVMKLSFWNISECDHSTRVMTDQCNQCMLTLLLWSFHFHCSVSSTAHKVVVSFRKKIMKTWSSIYTFQKLVFKWCLTH